MFLVVDGIGGQAAGEKAAEIAVARVRARLERQTGTAEQRIREAITMANNEILRAAESRPEWQGMACVLTVAVVEDGCAVVGHVGDSRLYQVRRGEIRKITHDHSPVGEREDNGELSEFEAMRHPRRNEVFRDVGSEERSPDDPDFIEIERVPFAPDSALVLCSDGLSDLVPSNRIRAAVERHAGHPEEAVKQLIDEANAAGGKDNVTVVVVEGETFGQDAATSPHGALAGRAATFVYGAALAVAAAFAAYWFTKPAPAKPVACAGGSDGRAGREIPDDRRSDGCGAAGRHRGGAGRRVLRAGEAQKRCDRAQPRSPRRRVAGRRIEPRPGGGCGERQERPLQRLSHRGGGAEAAFRGHSGGGYGR